MIESLYRKWLTSFLGCLYGEKGYISSPLGRKLVDKGVILITGVKKNIKPKSSILGTVVVSVLWLICGRGSSRIHFNQRSRLSIWIA
uniref:transposase n=1 Tax=Candidatus Enterovibrio escicola TaxID=1927127 RepID=UPI0018F1CF68|nr:transposase [Candidatus Enterovibrio escacola]